MATASQISSDPALEGQIFWEQYKFAIIAVVAVVILGALGYAGFQYYATQKTADASALLASAHAPAQFQEVINRYPGSEAAASAYLLLAKAQRSDKQFGEANNTLHKFIEQFPKHELITTAWMGVAANLVSLGQNDQAFSTYQRIATEYPKSYNAPLALLAEVPILKAKKNDAETRRILETILSQYRDSIVANAAIQELVSLPQPAKASVPAPTAAPFVPMARPAEPPAPASNATPATKP